MAVSRLRIACRCLMPVIAASLLAGMSSDAAAAYQDQPRIRLQLGQGSVDPSLTSGGINRFIFEKPGVGLPVAEQTFTFDRGPLKCTVTGTAGDTLVSLSGFPDRVGMGPDSMGVYNGATGVSCYRMTFNVNNSGKNEGITIALGGTNTDIPGVGKMSNYAFNRLELDMEVKGNAIFKLAIKDGNTYTLYSGRSLDLLEAQGATSGEQSPIQKRFACGATGADSNQDSGPNDNCRWIINDFGTSFTLTADTVGEGSLEGGGDWGGDYGGPEGAFANNTIIYLVRLSETGTLTCDSACDEVTGVCFDDRTGQIGDGESFARCSVTRLANVGSGGDSGGVCLKPFPYRLSTELSEDACNLDATTPDFTRQFAASVKVQFPPEARVNIEVPSIYYTQVQFACDSIANRPTSGICVGGLTPKFRPDRCKGTVVLDANGNKTIAEVLGPDDHYTAGEGSAIGVEDKTYSVPLDWACILETTIEYVGSDKMQRTDTVLFWGDARFSTQ